MKGIVVLNKVVRRIYTTLTISLENYSKRPSYSIGEHFERIYHYHIQKTGGTSLNHMFLSSDGGNSRKLYNNLARENSLLRRVVSNDKVYVGWDKQLIENGRYYYAFSHIPMHQLKLKENTFTITCFRDPKKRVISFYKELLEYKLNDIQHPCRVYSDKWLGSSFQDFLKNVPKSELLQQLYMFSPSYSVDEAMENILSCSFFFKTEQFEEATNKLSEKLRIDLMPIHVRKSVSRIQLADKETNLLDSFLEPEYKLLHQLEPYF